MNTILRRLNPVTLAILGTLCVPAPAYAELVDEAWIVRSGDGLYGIARKLAPKDLKMQARIRSEITQINPRLNPNALEIGMSLKLPDFLFEKQAKNPAPPVVAPGKQPESAGPMQISKAVTPDPQEIIGRVVIQSGKVVAENRGSSRPLNRTANILKGDTLKTAANARSQIRLKDGAIIAISPGTELKFEEFAYNGSEDGSERSIINLIRGGFRTITGAIGHTNKQNYQVRTSVATIGIRGTHYGLMLCDAGSCQNNAALGNLSDGLYGGVVDGSVVADNTAGQFVFNNDQFFHIPSQQMPAVETLLPPPVFQDALSGTGDQTIADSMAGSPDTNRHNPYVMLAQNPDIGQIAGRFVVTADQGTIGNTALPTPAANGSSLLVATTDAVNPLAFPVTVSAGSRDSIYTTDLAGTAVPVAAIDHYIGTDSLPHYNILAVNPSLATATINSTITPGVLTTAGVTAYWGRWDTAIIGSDAGLPQNMTAHFIGSNTMTTPTQLGGLTGTAVSYSVANLGTAFDANYNGIPVTAGVTVGMTADFMTQQITIYTANVNGLIGELDSTTPVPFTDLNRGFSLVDSAGCGGSCLLRGTATVQFIGNQAQGALTSFSLSDNTNTAAGVALLTQ